MTDAILRVRVARKSTEALDIVSLELVSVGNETLPPFSAGSHVDLHLPNGLIRQYSLCNDPRESHRYLLCILRDPASRGGSHAVHHLIVEADAELTHVPMQGCPPSNRHKPRAGNVFRGVRLDQ